MSSKIQTIRSHSNGRCDFAIKEPDSVLYSIGPDFQINKIDIKTRQITQTFNILDIYYSINICKSDPNQIVLGGVSSSVEIFSEEKFEESGFLAIKCFGSVYKIASDSAGKYLACVSDENTLCLFDYGTQKTYKCSKTHEAGCVNLCFQNPRNQPSKYASSTSCNGTINIYEIEAKDEKIELKKVKDQKIGKETVPLSEQILQAHWNPSGNVLGLPGSFCFAYFRLENGSFIHYPDTQISHDKDISLIHWISDDLLITVGLDKMIKIWDFNAKKLLFSEKTPDFIQNLEFVKSLNTIVFIDTNGHISFWTEDFPSIMAQMEASSLGKPAEPLPEHDKPQDSVTLNVEKKPLELIEEEKKPSDSGEKKQIIQKSDADNWIDAAPQQIFHSSATSFFKTRRFLCWNLVGTMIIRRDNEFRFLDIDFSDKNFHKNIRARDAYDFEMGDMNYAGAIMASRFVPLNENEYEDEIHDDESKKFSFVQFKSFSYLYEPCDWTVRLQKDENAECVCLGSNWCAVATDFNYIRVFNFVGVETRVLTFEKAIVSMSGYENLLAYVFHDGVPVLGCQNLRLRVYDTDEDCIILEVPVPITPYYTLVWFGFSNEGLIIFQESSGIIKGLFNKTNWVSFYDDNEESKLKRKFWLIGMIDYELIGVPLGKDELEPSPFPLPQTKIIEIELPVIKTKDWWSEGKIYEKILWKKLILEHEKTRNKWWFQWKYSRDKYDPFHRLSDSILSDSEIMNKEKEIEKMYVDFFRECLVKGEYERALNVVSTMIKYVKTIEICLIFCNKMNLGKIAEKINIILSEKIRRIEYLNAFKSQNGGMERSSNLLDVSNIQSQPQPQPIKKNKINLTTLAIQSHKQNPITVENLKNKKKTLMLDDYNNIEEGDEKNVPEHEVKVEEPLGLSQNPFSINGAPAAEKEQRTIFEVMQVSDSKKKRKPEEENTKVQKKIKF